MFVCFCVCLFVCLFVCMFVCMFVCWLVGLRVELELQELGLAGWLIALGWLLGLAGCWAGGVMTVTGGGGGRDPITAVTG